MITQRKLKKFYDIQLDLNNRMLTEATKYIENANAAKTTTPEKAQYYDSLIAAARKEMEGLQHNIRFLEETKAAFIEVKRNQYILTIDESRRSPQYILSCIPLLHAIESIDSLNLTNRLKDAGKVKPQIMKVNIDDL